RAVAREEKSGLPKLGGIATALERSAFLIMLEHRRETADPACRKSVDWPGGDAIHADFFCPEIVGKVTRAGLEAGFGDAHHVVVRDYFLSTVISHREDAASVGHEWRGGPAERYQGIGSDVVRCPEGVAGRVEEVALERFLGSESNRVQEQIESICL